MDNDTPKAMQETIRLKQEVWRLYDKLNKPDTAEQNINAVSRSIEIESIQEKLSQLTGID